MSKELNRVRHYAESIIFPKSKAFPKSQGECTAQAIMAMFLGQDQSLADQPEAYKGAISQINLLLSQFEVTDSKIGKYETSLSGTRFAIPEEMLITHKLVPDEVLHMRQLNSRLPRKSEYEGWLSVDRTPEGHTLKFGYAGRYPTYRSMRENLAKQAVGILDEETLPELFDEGGSSSVHEAFYREEWRINNDKVSEVEKLFVGCQFYSEPHLQDFSIIPEGDVEVPLRIAEEPSARAVNRLLAAVYSPFVGL